MCALLQLGTCLVGALSAACKPHYDRSLVQPGAIPIVSWTKQRELAHDRSSFTQGLVFSAGYLYESAGGERKSRVLKLDSMSGAIGRQREWPHTIAGTAPPPFAEGLAIDGGRLVQLSWKNERALTWTLPDLHRGPDLTYTGEGWGLCFDGAGYWRSDGTATLHRHGRGSFQEDAARGIVVKLNGTEVEALNELECIGDLVLANVWKTPYVLLIRASDGAVTGVLDFTMLIEDADVSGCENVLNGLAWDAQRRELYVTGKRWPKFYAVKINID